MNRLGLCARPGFGVGGLVKPTPSAVSIAVATYLCRLMTRVVGYEGSPKAFSRVSWRPTSDLQIQKHGRIYRESRAEFSRLLDGDVPFTS
jgi:hypothetical protein